MNKIKLLGQTFTEISVVTKMLKMYKGDLLKAKILEPSYGTGAFLMTIVRKIIKLGRNKNYSDFKIAKLINKNVHGYEIDKEFHEQCLRNLNAILEQENFKENIKFENLINKSTFDFANTNKYDLIIGNPPYVRIQNLNNEVKQIREKLNRTKGNTDLFLLIIDFYLNRLNFIGQFIFIVPNSLGKSKAALLIRKWMFENGQVNYYDFEDQQLFPTVSVYSCIFDFMLNSNEKSLFFSPSRESGWNQKPKKISSFKVFQPKVLKIIKEDLGIRNGVATLADKIFIFDTKPDLENVFRIYKGSRSNQKKYALFPYKIIDDKVLKFDSEKEFKQMMPKAYEYLHKNKKLLENRSLEKKSKWFEFGRSQAIMDISEEKYLINTLIKPGSKKLEILKIEKYSLVYSGLYTTSDKVLKINNEALIKSLRFSAKDMRGGYKKISSSLFKNESK